MNKLRKRVISFVLAVLLVVPLIGGNLNMQQVQAEGEAETGVLSFEYRYGESKYIQVNTNLPTDIPIKDFTAGDNGCNIDQSGNQYQQVGWVGMANADGTIVLTFNFGSAFESGQTYVLPKGAIFGFTNGKNYALDKDYTFTWDGSNWSMEAVAEPETETLSLECRRWGKNNLLQVNTNLPSTITCADFLSTDNGCEIDQSGSSQTFGYASMSKEGETVIITFNFNNALTEGQTFTLKKDSVFGFKDTTTKYVLDKEYTFVYNGGESWSLQDPEPDPEPDPEVLNFQYKWGNGTTLQVYTNLPEGTYKDFLAEDSGYSIVQEGNGFGYAHPEKADNKMIITFHFNEAFTKKETYTIKQGSIFTFGGTKYILDKDYFFTYTGTEWVEGEWSEPAPEVENDVNGDGVVNVADYLHLKKVLKEIVEKDDRCDIISDGYLNDWDMTLMRELLFGLVQSAEEIMARPAYILEEYHYQGGEDFITFADMPVNSTDTAKIEEFKALGFNTSLLTEDCIGGFNATSYSGECTTSDAITVSGETLELTYNTTNGSFIQFKTNLPAGESYTYSNFLVGADGFQINLDGSTKTPSWFAMDVDGGVVYLTMHFQKDGTADYFNPGEQQVLRAGSTFTFNSTTYTLDKTYTVTIRNNYLAAIENLDKAGLNVWIRNQNNRYGYFTDEITAQLKRYADKIDGFYMADEAFETNDLLTTAGQENEAGDFTSLAPMTEWLNTNFPNAYYHMNQVPIGSYDHYGDGKTQDADKYTAFLQSYQDTFLKNLNANSGKSICFDNYPFIQSQSNGIAGIGAKPGIAQTYLQNMVLAANSAKEYNANSTNGKADFGTCIQTFEAYSGTGDTHRDITKAEEVSFQLYVGMACGADLFEYFAYNSSSAYNISGIMNEDGSERIYNLVKTANDNALCFADVINTFTWQGIETSNGSKNNANKSAFSDVSSLVLKDTNDGVLSSVSSTDDAMVGYFTKGEQDGYMVVNYNDPVAVTGNNSVTLNFEGCTQARIYTSSNGELQSEILNLSNGSYTVTLTPGSACFIIPV